MTPSVIDLNPSELVDELRAASLPEVDTKYGSAPLLLIEIGDHDDELEDGLYRTLAQEGKPVRPSLGLFSQTSPGFATVAIPKRGEPDVDPMELLARLRRHPYFALPLFKRDRGPADATRITVGRQTGWDVLLRHGTVSKKHAYFEIDDSGALYLADCDSKNGTHVNGARLKSGEVRWLQPLDHIHFGSVSAFTCSASVLRGVILLS
jgi:hypothetical protein